MPLRRGSSKPLERLLEPEVPPTGTKPFPLGDYSGVIWTGSSLVTRLDGMRLEVLILDPRATRAVRRFDAGPAVRLRTHNLPLRIRLPSRIAWSATGVGGNAMRGFVVKRITADDRHGHVVASHVEVPYPPRPAPVRSRRSPT